MNQAPDKRTGKLDIGLSYYQEEQWISAIKHYGREIMDRSLLSFEQKSYLSAESIARQINKASY